MEMMFRPGRRCDRLCDRDVTMSNRFGGNGITVCWETKIERCPNTVITHSAVTTSCFHVIGGASLCFRWAEGHRTLRQPPISPAALRGWSLAGLRHRSSSRSIRHGILAALIHRDRVHLQAIKVHRRRFRVCGSREITNGPTTSAFFLEGRYGMCVGGYINGQIDLIGLQSFGYSDRGRWRAFSVTGHQGQGFFCLRSAPWREPR